MDRYERINALHHFLQQAGHGQEALFGAGGGFGNLKHIVFGFVQQLRRIFALRVIGISSNFRTHLRQLAHN